MKMIIAHTQKNCPYGCCGVKTTKHGKARAEASEKRLKRALKRKDRQEGRKEILDSRREA